MYDPTSPPPIPSASTCDMLDNIVLDVLCLCTCKVARARRRHAEPYANTLGARIHFSHDLDLTVTLRDVQLIDANRIYPYIAGLMFATQISERAMQIKRNEKVLM